MNWEAISAVGEIVGALAVVISLIYLAVQIRAQNRESRMAAVHDILEAFRSIQTVGQDAEMSKLLVRSIDSFDDLEDHERMRVISAIGPMIRVWEEAYFQFRSGRLEEEIWETMIAQYSDLMATNVFQQFWAIRKHVYSTGFRALVEKIETGEYKLE